MDGEESALFDEDALLPSGSSSDEDYGDGPSSSDDDDVKEKKKPFNCSDAKDEDNTRSKSKQINKGHPSPKSNQNSETVQKKAETSVQEEEETPESRNEPTPVTSAKSKRKKGHPPPFAVPRKPLASTTLKYSKECEICGKRISHAQYKGHQVYFHGEERPFKCEICGYRFASKGHLLRHGSSHRETIKKLNKRIRYCKFCQWGFFRHDLLTQHENIHRKSKAFLCSFPHCDMSFFSQERLDDHYPVHSDPAPFKCGICSKGYKHRNYLGDHMRRCHQISLDEYLDSISTYDTVLTATLVGSYVVPPIQPQVAESPQIDDAQVPNSKLAAEGEGSSAAAGDNASASSVAAAAGKTSASSAVDKETSASSAVDKKTPASSAVDKKTSASSAVDKKTPASSAVDKKTSAGSAVDKKTSASSAVDKKTSASSVADSRIETERPSDPSTSTNELDKEGEEEMEIKMEPMSPECSGSFDSDDEYDPRKIKNELESQSSDTESDTKVEKSHAKPTRILTRKRPIRSSRNNKAHVDDDSNGSASDSEDELDDNVPDSDEEYVPTVPKRKRGKNVEPPVDLNSKQRRQPSNKSKKKQVPKETPGKPSEECEVCGQVIPAKDMTKHRREVHHLKYPPGMNKKECDICGKMISKKRYNEHKRFVHENIRPFKCSLCGCEFSQSTHMKRHMTTHNFPVTKPVKKICYCKYCRWGFFRRDKLDQHVKLHHESEAIPCTVSSCRLTFFSKQHLEDHLIVHTDPLPFKCPKCSKCYRGKTNMMEHLRQKHSNTLDCYLDSISTYETVFSETLKILEGAPIPGSLDSEPSENQDSLPQQENLAVSNSES